MRNKSEHPIITVIGCGMMGSSITWPAAYNGCKIRYVGSPLDGEIIAHARATGEHLTLKRPIPAGTEFYTVDEMDKALEGADLSICGVSSFGLDWYLDYVIPRLPDGVPVLSISKGMIHLGEGKMISYPEKMEEVAAANAVADGETVFRNLYEFIKETLGEDNAVTLFGSDNFDEIDLMEVKAIYLKIGFTYEAAVDRVKRESQVSAEDKKMVMDFLKNSENLNELTKRFGDNQQNLRVLR